MKILVGLGNPGRKYLFTRHNIGFMALDGLAHRLGFPAWSSAHKSEITKMKVAGQEVVLIKPQTFMNLSGEAVVSFLNFYKIQIPSPEHSLLVLHDEIDIPFLTLRYQTERGHGGHNGVRSVHQLLGHNQYDRLKLGVGRPSHDRQDVASFVLENFSSQEEQELPSFLDVICDSLETYIEKGFQIAATQYNNKTKG